MNQVLQTIQDFVASVGFIPTLIMLALLGLYIFWAESHTTRKDRNSVFDIFLFVFFITIIWGRFSYVLSNPAEYEGLIWSIVPYEKYVDGTYYFRLLPWKFFKIWDGGFLFISMYVSFNIIAFTLSTFLKKWRWRESIGVVTISASVMLGFALIATGMFSSNWNIVKQGGMVILIYLLYLLIHYILKLMYKNVQDTYERAIFIVHFSYFVIVNTFLLLSFLLSDITLVDRYNLYVLVAYCILSSLVFIYDMQRKNIVLDTVFRTPKLPKVGSVVRIKKEK
ncbi:hypothetical protein HYV12_00790 [Candidatus Dojkabacteria bacterium]|nr:hypothetical protein [Candidatus Dojkabacteria bacterium]